MPKNLSIFQFYSRVHRCQKILHLIKEVPRKTEAENTAISGIMGSKEILHAATTAVDVTHHDEESGMLQMHVGIYINERITANLHA